jgi:RimJ/RimL family protein N-acetyltransferase
MQFRFEPLTELMAREALKWRYPPPYDFYNPPDEITDETIAALFEPASPQYGVFDEGDQLIGLIGTGPDAQVPGGDYSAPAIDIGIGLHPNHCGRGLGREVVSAFIAFLEEREGPSTYRATIAAFNHRSLKTFQSLGFTETSRFETGPTDSPTDWVILTNESDQ